MLHTSALLRQIFYGNPDPVTVLGTDFRIIVLNEASRRLLQTVFQVEVEEGENLLDIMAGEPSFQAAARENWSRVFRGESFVTTSGSTSYLHGGAARFELSYQPLRVGDRVVGGVNRFRDVTAKVRAEAELRRANEELEQRVARRTAELAESEERLRLAMDAAQLGTWDLDLRTGVATWSARARAMFGVAPDAPVSYETFVSSIYPEDRDRMLETMRAQAAESRGFQNAFRIVLPDGSVRSIVGRGAALHDRDADGRPRAVRIIGVMADVTDHARAEEALRESEERFRTAFETSPDVITISRLDDAVYASVNATFTRVSGWSEAEVRGRSALALQIWGDQRDRATFAEALRRDGYVHNLETTFRTKEGRTFPGLISATIVKLRGEPYVLSTSRDITRWKEAEQERERLAAALQQAAKMEAVGQLAGGIAHDFNNLLTVILSGADALGDAPAACDQAEIVTDIRDAGERARDLTAQLLAFARRQVSTPVVLDLNAHVLRSQKMLGRVLGEDVELVTRLDPGLWSVRCDPGQLEQVVLNLAVNARHAMPQGGSLALETSNLALEREATGACGAIRPGDYVRLRVEDSGEGIAPDVKSRIFEPFFTTKPAGRGTGLGLATVYGIVKQHEGNIVVHSEPGHGTTFEILLPRSAEVAREPTAPSVAAPRRGSETVLVVEDEPRVREVTARALRSGGYQVLVANDANDALEVVARAPARPRLLITDVIMPGMHGRALADELRREDPGLRVLFVSGYTQDVIVQHGAHDPGVDFLQKPFTASSLLERVRVVLDLA